MKRDIGQELIEGMKEAIAHARGEVELETTTIEVDAPDVKVLRGRLEMTQEEFAVLVGISVHTLRCWEQGRRQPEGPARALLQIVDREPEAVLRALHGEDLEGERRRAR